MLQEEAGDLQQDGFISDPRRSCLKHQLSLINDILDLAVPRGRRMEAELTDFHLPTVIDTAVTLVRERAGRRGITPQATVDPQLADVRADEWRLKQVMLNLLSNAIKFTPEGGRIDVRAGVTDGTVEVSVADGVGHRARGSGDRLRGVPPGRDGGQEGRRYGARPRAARESSNRTAAASGSTARWGKGSRSRSRFRWAVVNELILHLARVLHPMY